MFAASVGRATDLAVVRAPLVRADAEHFAQIALQRDEEPGQVEHRLPDAVLVDNDLGPRGPSYQRCAVWARPSGDSTCRRDRIECAHRVIDILRSLVVG